MAWPLGNQRTLEVKARPRSCEEWAVAHTVWLKVPPFWIQNGRALHQGQSGERKDSHFQSSPGGQP